MLSHQRLHFQSPSPSAHQPQQPYPSILVPSVTYPPKGKAPQSYTSSTHPPMQSPHQPSVHLLIHPTTCPPTDPPLASTRLSSHPPPSHSPYHLPLHLSMQPPCREPAILHPSSCAPFCPSIHPAVNESLLCPGRSPLSPLGCALLCNCPGSFPDPSPPSRGDDPLLSPTQFQRWGWFPALGAIHESSFLLC